MPNFIKIRHIVILRPNLPKFLILGQYQQFQISYLWLRNLTCSDYQILWHWEHISFLGPNFPGIRRLMLALMSNVYHLAVILIFLVVTACYLVVTARYCLLLGGYWWLLLIPAHYCSFPLLVWTFTNWYLLKDHTHFKQTCSFQLQVCSSMCNLLVNTRG